MRPLLSESNESGGFSSIDTKRAKGVDLAKGLRDRNSPTCTFSQNGYGAQFASLSAPTDVNNTLWRVCVCVRRCAGRRGGGGQSNKHAAEENKCLAQKTCQQGFRRQRDRVVKVMD